MFGHGLFPDSVLATAEQDITKHESAGVSPGPSPGASQCSSWRDSARESARYRPYEKRESQQGTGQVDQGQQPWHQFSRNRNRGHGRGRGSNPHLSRSRGNISYK